MFDVVMTARRRSTAGERYKIDDEESIDEKMSRNDLLQGRSVLGLSRAKTSPCTEEEEGGHLPAASAAAAAVLLLIRPAESLSLGLIRNFLADSSEND